MSQDDTGRPTRDRKAPKYLEDYELNLSQAVGADSQASQQDKNDDSQYDGKNNANDDEDEDMASPMSPPPSKKRKRAASSTPKSNKKQRKNPTPSTSTSNSTTPNKNNRAGMVPQFALPPRQVFWNPEPSPIPTDFEAALAKLLAKPSPTEVSAVVDSEKWLFPTKCAGTIDASILDDLKKGCYYEPGVLQDGSVDPSVEICFCFDLTGNSLVFFNIFFRQHVPSHGAIKNSTPNRLSHAIKRFAQYPYRHDLLRRLLRC